MGAYSDVQRFFELGPAGLDNRHDLDKAFDGYARVFKEQPSFRSCVKQVLSDVFFLSIQGLTL